MALEIAGGQNTLAMLVKKYVDQGGVVDTSTTTAAVVLPDSGGRVRL